MGEQHAPRSPRDANASRDAFLAMAAAYQAMFPSDDAAHVKASFEVIYLIGWAPHASQPKPDRRGSATAKIGDVTAFPEPATYKPDGDGGGFTKA